MGKYSTKKVHFNPKRKKPNKNHNQKYFKPENKKVDKSKYYEVKGNREELAPYVGDEFIAKGFLTNSYKYSGTRRLVNSLILPIYKDGKNIYVNHLWVKSERTDNISHGFKTFKVKIIEYKDLYNGSKKYGIQFIELKD